MRLNSGLLPCGPPVQRAASSKFFVGACAVPGILCGRVALRAGVGA
jgi:hypothetical protein